MGRVEALWLFFVCSASFESDQTTLQLIDLLLPDRLKNPPLVKLLNNFIKFW